MEGREGWRVQRERGSRELEGREGWRVERDGGYGAIGTRT